jgi:hypothetical protein
MKERSMKKGLLLVAVLLLLNGCLPGIYITQKEPTAQGQTVEFRLGNKVEVAQWVALQKQVCGDLDSATVTLPADVRADIYKYSCVEPDRHALGETLSKLTPEQIDGICSRLDQKDYAATKDKIPTPPAEFGSAMLMLLFVFAMM